MDIIFDIETMGTAPEELVRALYPEYPAFDPDAVKVGNLKTEEAKLEKIETARQTHAEQEAAYWSEKMEKRALRAETGSVLTIAYLGADSPAEDAEVDDGGGDETKLIERFWRTYTALAKRGDKLVGWNSGAGMTVGFDLGFLIKRSWILGIQLPAGVTRGRFVSDVFLDLMQTWCLNEFKQFAKLDHAARVLGIGNKTEQEVCGAEFASYFLRGGPDKELALHYAKLDVILTRDIFHKLYPSPVSAACLCKVE